jgi:hypothetical protein
VPFVEGVATGVVGNAVYGVPFEALKMLRARRSGWDQAMLRSLSHHDVTSSIAGRFTEDDLCTRMLSNIRIGLLPFDHLYASLAARRCPLLRIRV